MYLLLLLKQQVYMVSGFGLTLHLSIFLGYASVVAMYACSHMTLATCLHPYVHLPCVSMSSLHMRRTHEWILQSQRPGGNGLKVLSWIGLIRPHCIACLTPVRQLAHRSQIVSAP